MTVPQEKIGPYEVIAHLARGGMAEVYLARTTGLEGFERICVLKRVRPQASNPAQFLDMFLDEARIAAALQHANIVQVYDVQKDAEGLYYMAMEYLHGQDLSRVLRRAWAAQDAGAEGVPLEQAVCIISSLCAGLHYAHERKDREGNPLQVVHRDVSPQNVFVTYEGQVKIVDFGIAKAEHRLVQTQVGAVKGKMGYMAPEQAVGEVVDRRADVFALGILAWELTVGRRLFSDGSDYEKMRRIVREDAPAPSSVLPDYPAPLEGIVMRCLRRDRDTRYQTLGDVRRDLEGFARGQGMTLSTLGVAEMMGRLFPGRLELEQIVRGAMAGDTATALIGIPSSLRNPEQLDGADSQSNLEATSQGRMHRFESSEGEAAAAPTGSAEEGKDEPSLSPTRITSVDAPTRARRRARIGLATLVVLAVALGGIVWLQLTRPETIDLVDLFIAPNRSDSLAAPSRPGIAQPRAAQVAPAGSETPGAPVVADEAYDDNLAELKWAAKRLARKRKGKLKERLRMKRFGGQGAESERDAAESTTDGTRRPVLYDVAVEDGDLSTGSIVEGTDEGKTPKEPDAPVAPRPADEKSDSPPAASPAP